MNALCTCFDFHVTFKYPLARFSYFLDDSWFHTPHNHIMHSTLILCFQFHHPSSKEEKNVKLVFHFMTRHDQRESLFLWKCINCCCKQGVRPSSWMISMIIMFERKMLVHMNKGKKRLKNRKKNELLKGKPKIKRRKVEKKNIYVYFLVIRW